MKAGVERFVVLFVLDRNVEVRPRAYAVVGPAQPVGVSCGAIFEGS